MSKNIYRRFTRLFTICVLVCFVSGQAFADPAADFLSEGMRNLTNHQNELAISNFSEAIKLDPKSFQAYEGKGRADAAIGKFKSALSDLDEAIDLNATNARLYTYKANVLVAAGHSGQALFNLDEAIRLDPNYVAAYLERGLICEETGDYMRALADETRVIELDPTMAAAFYTRGKTYKHMEEFDKAMIEFNRAIELDPKNPFNFAQCATIQNQLGHFDEAIADCDKAISLRQTIMPIELNPMDTLLYFTRAMAYASKGDYKKAIRDLGVVITIDPKSSAAYSSRGLLQARQGDYSRGIADCEKAVEIDPKYANGYNNLAWLLAICPDAKKRDGKRALEEARKACELTRWKDALCLGTFAAAFAETGDFAGAVKWQKKSIETGLSKKAAADAQKFLKLYEAKKPYHEKKFDVLVEGQ